MTIDAGNVGTRMVVRYAVGGIGSGGGPLMSDVIGRILAVDDTAVAIERRDGSVVSVALDSIVITKVVPSLPTRSRNAHRISAENLMRICTRGWPPVVSEPLGEWELRAAGGFTGRANSVAVHGDPGCPDDQALAAVVEFYRGQRLPARAQVIVGSPWERVFLDAGWAVLAGVPDGAIVQVAQMADALAETEASDDAEIVVESTASDAWMRGYHRVEDPEIARAVLEGPHTVGFISLGEFAVGHIVVTGEWAGISGVEVAPASRRQGLARRIVDTGLRWAAARGADKAYLQTMRHNTGALALCAPYCFRDHHEYRYLSPPH